ncbi:MAG: CoA transferase [Acidobacteria bacterium]|nr:CoA transferase [Acidobacteriota bacterium]
MTDLRRGPLVGVTVLDLTRVLSGPYCTMLLADMGARVIKVEQPGKGDDTRAWGPPFLDGESAYFLSINRNKESVTLDFKPPEGRLVLERLVAAADVLVENFRPGTLDRVGFGYEQLAARFPRLVYCSVSGFGHTGPRRDRAGYDAVIQAEGGLMSITGGADGPPYRLGVAIADIVAGMFAAQGISLALFHRERAGRGQHVDVGMLDSVAALLTYQASIFFATGSSPTRMGNRHPTIVPYETFPAQNGEFVLAVGNDDLWRRFCRTVDREDLATDPRFGTNQDRVGAYDELRRILTGLFSTRTREAWIELLTAAGIPCGSVREVADVLNDPHLMAREMVREVLHPTAGAVKVLGTPVKLSGSPGRVHSSPPLLGQHTDQVLTRDLGFSPQDVERLRAQGVI